MILKYAILNGALELLPDTLATMAIIPMQMKMVYRIGKTHGVELDRSNIKDFLATAGVGLGSQVVEGFARKLMAGFGKKLAGKMAGQVAGQVTGSAFSFGTHLCHRPHRRKVLLRRLQAGTRRKSRASSPPSVSRARNFMPDTCRKSSSAPARSTRAEILSMVRGKAAV